VGAMGHETGINIIKNGMGHKIIFSSNVHKKIFNNHKKNDLRIIIKVRMRFYIKKFILDVL
jgi:hypothetical protein